MKLRAAVALVALVASPFLADGAFAQSIREYSNGITQAPTPRSIALGPDGNLWFSEEFGNRIGKITPAGVVTEYSAGLSPGAGPGSITAGPDGNLWFVERSGNRIGRITTAGAITEFSAGITANARPVAITPGPDGALWFLETSANKIGRITTTGTITEYSTGLTASAGLSSIVTGPDGNLWFTEGTSNKVGYINPTTHAITEFSAGITASSNPSGLAAGPDGNLWFTELNGNRIGMITTGGTVTEFSAGITAGSGPRNIVAGPDGNLWFTETTASRIGMITTAGVVTEYSAGITAGSQPWGIVVGPGGAGADIWFTEYVAGQIGKITTAGVATEYGAGITSGAFPFYIAAGPDGNLWFTEPGIGAIGRITPAGVVTEFSSGITPGALPIAIAKGPDGNLWFTEYNGDRIGRITPAGVVTEFATGITPGSHPAAITAGPDNNMWFTEDAGRVGRIIAIPANGTVGTITEFSAGITAGALPGDIAAGPDGNLWFTESGIDRIARITPAGVVTEFGAGISAGSRPQGITKGPDNNMWFTETNAARVGRIVAIPANGTVGDVTEIFGTSGATEFITAGPDGNLWFTLYTSNRIGRVTPSGIINEFAAGLSANAGLEGIAAGPDGNVWFVENNTNRVGRITMTSDFIVTNNNDSGDGSLRDAIIQANGAAGSPTIGFAPAVTGTITLTSGQIQIARGMTITGPGAATLTINGNAANRILSIFQTDPACPALDGPDYLVSISGLRFANGRRLQSNAGGAIFTEHSLSLDGVILEDNIAANGGAITMSLQYPGQSLTINNTQFLNNKGQPIGPSAAGIFGAAIAVYERCTGTHTTPVPVNITGSVFSGNQALPVTLYGLGGAIATDSVADFTITDTRIVGNSVIAPNPPLGTQLYRGGGIYGHAKSLTIVRSEISGNSAFDVTAADLTRGGGISVFNNDPTLQGAGDTMVVKIVNSTVSGNSSSATAGAILVLNNASLELDNSTVSDNAAASGRTGGIVFSTGTGLATPTFKMVSSILANSQTGVTDLATNLASIPTFTVDATNSLIETICPSPACVITVNGTGNLIAVDPMLGPLANNGGPTQTQALLAGSPAINAGSNPLALTTDQRGTGFPRTQGGVTDMGAYESTPSASAPVLQNAKSRKTHGGTPFDLTLAP